MPPFRVWRVAFPVNLQQRFQEPKRAKPVVHARPENIGSIDVSSEKSKEQIWDEWQDLVNMAPKELEEWLETEESRSVGDTSDGESTGHKSGRRIVEIKQTKKDDLSDDDWDHMAKVVGYIKRHLSQGGPEEEAKTSAWRYSLKNWGHDPFA